MHKSFSSFNVNTSGGGDWAAGRGDNALQKSFSVGNCSIEKKRGFKPSDRHDPGKKQFLVELSKQIWQKSEESSSNVSKKVDLHKIFTPATDAEEILPKNRKLYSSSAFYSPTLHPTVEDQVELARRISHSLSDTNNKKSKGQSMYVNRKKRSVKWVHEGCAQDLDDNESDLEAEGKENTSEAPSDKQPAYKKLPLHLIMNPRGQMRDIHTDEDAINFATGLLSPDRCAEVVNALQTQKGRGGELFAKRRRKSDKWIVDETNAGTHTPSGLPDYHQYQPKPPTSPSIMPAYSDAGKHRVQLNMHQEQLLEKYAKPGLTVVKTPWEAALETGSASAAFVENRKPSPVPTLQPSVAPQYHDTGNMNRSMPVASGSPYAAADVSPSPYGSSYDNQTQTMSHSQYASQAPRANLQRDLAYKPNVPQGWKAPSVTLPKDLYIPKEIPLGSYAPPPEVKLPSAAASTWQPSSQQQQQQQYSQPAQTLPPMSYSPCPASGQTPPSAYGSGFPVAKTNASGFSSYTPPAQSAYAPPKQPHYAPNSYQRVPQNTSQGAPPVNFNPSPLPYDKLAKFENPEPSQNNYGSYGVPPSHHLSARGGVGSKVRNLSPLPYGGGRGPSSVSPRPMASPVGYSDYSNNSCNSGYSGTPVPAAAPRSPRLSRSDLMHGQTFNNSARGWKAGAPAFRSSSGSAASRPHIQAAQSIPITTSNLPYTDF